MTDQVALMAKETNVDEWRRSPGTNGESYLNCQKQTTFYCPICDCSYNVYSSITRHITLKHETDIEYLYKCCDCEITFESRKELGRHASDNHRMVEERPPPSRKGAFHCSFCEESFATQRGQAQHKRNRHPIRLSKYLANLASQPDDEEEQAEASVVNESSKTSQPASQPTHWPIHLTNSPIREMFNIGCSSDITLAKAVGTEKTAHQVGKVKRRILSQYPDWKETFCYLNETATQQMREVSYNETESEESSETSSEESRDGPDSPPEPLEIIVLEGAATQEEPASSPGKATNVVIAYPIQVILECPHCHMKWVGDALEGYADHLASHEEFAHSWMFLCALCAEHASSEQDILNHLVKDHVPDLATLPISTIKQGKSVLLPMLQGSAPDGEEQTDGYRLNSLAASSGPASPQPSSSSESTSPPPTPPVSEDEEVPPLPPPLDLPGIGCSPREEPGRLPLPGSPISDTPFPSSPTSDAHGEMPEVLYSQVLYSPISDTPLPPLAKDSGGPPTERDGADTTKNLQKKREEEKKALEELKTKYLNKLAEYTEDSLTEDQWRDFCTNLKSLSEELWSLLDSFKSQNNPARGNQTRQWQRRRGRSNRRQQHNTERRDQGEVRTIDLRVGSNNDNRSGRNDNRSGRNDNRSGRNDNRSGRNDNRSGRNNSKVGRDNYRSDRREDDRIGRSSSSSTGSRITGRQKWIQQAKRIQAQYRRNAKSCVEKLLHPNEEREVCGIPMDQIHHQMTETYANTSHEGEQPEWVNTPHREGVRFRF